MKEVTIRKAVIDHRVYDILINSTSIATGVSDEKTVSVETAGIWKALISFIRIESLDEDPHIEFFPTHAFCIPLAARRSPSYSGM